MTNMSYCRFHNTYADLRDCYEHILDKLSTDRPGGEAYDSEFNKRQKLIELCIRIANEYGVKDAGGALTGKAEDMLEYEADVDEDEEC